MKTLLLSPCPQTRQLLGEVLTRRGDEWTVIENAEAARPAVQSDNRLLVILDLALGIDRCVRACRELRQLSPDRSCTILVAGECLQSEHLEALLAAGVDDFLTDLEDPRHLALRLALAEHRAGCDGRRPLVESTSLSHDMAGQKQAESALQASERRLRNVLENMPDFLILVDRDATIRFVNRGTPHVPAERLLGANGFSFSAPEHREPCQAAFQRALDTRRTQTVEMMDVFGIWWACRLVPMLENGRVDRVMIICTDITELKTAALELEKEQRLLREMLDLHERDRRLIAYEIHDGFAQQLTGARFNLEAFDRLREEKPEDARKFFQLGLQLLSAGITESRRLISGLRPPVLDELGVVAAIEYLVAETREQGGVEVEFVKRVEFQRLAQPLESAVFRIVQESLTNTCRHSHSDKVRVELLQRGDWIVISTHDWGVGFSPEDVGQDRFGLQGIRERARLMGGKVTIEAAPGEGTRVYVELPLVEAAAKLGDGPESSR